MLSYICCGFFQNDGMLKLSQRNSEKRKKEKAKEAEELTRYQDKAVANYKKNKGIEEPKPTPASTSGKK